MDFGFPARDSGNSAGPRPPEIFQFAEPRRRYIRQRDSGKE